MTALSLALALLCGQAAQPLFVAEPLTKPGAFTAGIEGPACNRAGEIFAVNFAEQGTLGRVTPAGAGEVFVRLPGKSVGNGLRFGPRGELYVADYVGHNLLRVDPQSKEITVVAHDEGLNQPNDLAIADDGTLYCSDPAWGKNTGQLWRVKPGGKFEKLAGDLGTTNGVEVSPDGKTLYVNESVQRGVWAFPITAAGLGPRNLVKQFPDHGFDGMRCDIAGNLYLTRYGKGTVVKLSPTGEVLQEVAVLGKQPSNLCFGGPDGCTVYVTEVEHTRLVQFRVDQPGREWRQQRAWAAAQH